MTYQEIEQQIRSKVVNRDNSYTVLFHTTIPEKEAKQGQTFEDTADLSLIEAIKACIHANINKNRMICKVGSYWDYELQAMYYDVRV